MKPNECDFIATDAPDEYRCRKCGFIVRGIRVLPLHKTCGVASEIKAQGLGDSVAVFIKFISRGRIKLCGGCNSRRQYLNRVWPYHKSWAWWNKRICAWFSGKKLNS